MPDRRPTSPAQTSAGQGHRDAEGAHGGVGSRARKNDGRLAAWGIYYATISVLARKRAAPQ
jgi:hypothetical protein